MNRRAVFTAPLPLIAGAVATGGLVGEILDAAPVDPHRAWLEKWRKVLAASRTAEDGSEIETALSREESRLSRLICNTPASTLEGLTAQFIWLKEDMSPELTQLVGDDYRNWMSVMSTGFQNLHALT